MRYLALACDYDGTLALHGTVDEATLAALERFRASGRKLLLVTGRRLDDLGTVFSRLDLFEWVVAENGALLLHTATRRQQPLAERPSEAFLAALKDRGVAPFDVGHTIVATWEPHETVVLATIRDLGLELQVIFNKGAVMVLPAGVNKATGLAAALDELGISRHNVVAIGDAENDHALLESAEVSVAVANAVLMLKERADLVTESGHGAGVAELIDQIIASDLSELSARLKRHRISLSDRKDDEQPILLPAQGANLLIGGPSGSGKSAVAGAFVERLTEAEYQFCAIDPAGDLASLPGAVVMGSKEQAPNADEVVTLLEKPRQSAVVNFSALRQHERARAVAALVSLLAEMRARTARPHWIIVYDAHAVAPASLEPDALAWATRATGLLLVTDDPKLVATSVLEGIDLVIALGEHPERTLKATAAAAGVPPTTTGPHRLTAGEALVWDRKTGQPPVVARVARAKVERSRQHLVAVDGELPHESSFYFRGAEEKLNLRAHNLVTFLQLAAGVDDDTWSHHLRQGDYSAWFREKVGDESLGDEVAEIEQQPGLSPAESRQAIKSLIETRYALTSSKK